MTPDQILLSKNPFLNPHLDQLESLLKRTRDWADEDSC